MWTAFSSSWPDHTGLCSCCHNSQLNPITVAIPSRKMLKKLLSFHCHKILALKWVYIFNMLKYTKVLHQLFWKKFRQWINWECSVKNIVYWHGKIMHIFGAHRIFSKGYKLQTMILQFFYFFLHFFGQFTVIPINHKYFSLCSTFWKLNLLYWPFMPCLLFFNSFKKYLENQQSMNPTNIDK